MFNKKVIVNKALSRLVSDLPWLCTMNKKGPPYLPVSCVKYLLYGIPIRQIVQPNL